MPDTGQDIYLGDEDDITVKAAVIAVTEKGVMLKFQRPGSMKPADWVETWFPRAHLIVDDEKGTHDWTKGVATEVTIPYWLADQKGLAP